MNKAEFEEWKQHTEASKRTWTLDPIHNGQHGQDYLFHRGGIDGQFIEVTPIGLIRIGNYTGAVPHIGEAMIRVHYSKKCRDVGQALNVLVNKAGLHELSDLV